LQKVCQKTKKGKRERNERWDNELGCPKRETLLDRRKNQVKRGKVTEEELKTSHIGKGQEK